MVQPLEIWGGFECTINRVGDIFHDQLLKTGHAARTSDLALAAGLGVRTLRYPLLWEMIDNPSDHYSWTWAARRLDALRELGIRPIVGLLHHGSGPRGTQLLDPEFPTKFASFAARVATRFPWVCDYTPINEPLTTARFSCLYGLWHPHHRSDSSFARAIVNQAKAVSLAMQAIRRINPDARLIQTEDLGTTYSSEHLAYQRDFDNERRWLTWDLLCGRVDARHPLASFLIRNSISPLELDALRADPCPPDILGINHYVTSDRYLDEAVTEYPDHPCGTNGTDCYVDLDAVRVLPGAYRGWRVLHATWKRYQIPLALTEVHLGCTREEQLRWLHDALQAANAARARGCNVFAVTSWALLGGYDWSTLLTRTAGTYEAGAFDVRALDPRPTAIAKTLQRLHHDPSYMHPAATGRGWWQRADKLVKRRGSPTRTLSRRTTHPVLICGGAGSLGRAFASACLKRNLCAETTTRTRLDICNAAQLRDLVHTLRPWAIINAAGFVDVDGAESRDQECFAANTMGPTLLAAVAADLGIPLLTYSTDLVFDGTKQHPYEEMDATAPLSAYGRSKAAAESATLRYEKTLCIRTAAFFGHRHDFLWRALRTLQDGECFAALDDVVISPTYLPDLVNRSLDLLIDEASGLYHIANEGPVTWFEFAKRAAAVFHVDSRRLTGINLSEARPLAPRPRYSAMTSARCQPMPWLDDALSRYRPDFAA